MRIVFIVFCFLAIARVYGQQTEVQFLSGTGNDRTVNWDFYCTEGRNSGKWTTIPVPSNWELQGFGKYNYGLDKDSVRGHEKGLYKYVFTVPAGWKGRRVNIVFDGSMTDTEVKINGRSAGMIHQGAFYRFKYDISGLLRYGGTNKLEVTVYKESSNLSVNMAERHCDFWIFGGIYRPVFLEALPAQHIGWQAVDARADGQFTGAVRLAGYGSADRVVAQVYTLKGEKFGEEFNVPVHRGDTLVKLRSPFSSPLLWTPESPNLYKVVYSLQAGSKVLHTVEQRFGFRTVELRERDGIYVNGVRVKFKGICRHSFWPESGRTLSKGLSILDVQLMKDMNMNAVRMSHYPPDDHFLDVCDSLGVFVLDELTGWQHAYDTQVGSKLVKEMIEKDVNHPSIVIWDNGNEGGFNFDLDPLFDRLDIQSRPLIHPWAVFRHTDTQHYISYDYGDGAYWHGHDIVFPTEFLHGLYDGGHGAGLSDFWELMWNEPLSAGGFLWDFSDEAVVRTDKDSILDADKDHGPDGILGPHREKEGSYYAVKEVWSPVKVLRREVTATFNGILEVENRFLYTNLQQCHFSWRLTSSKGPSESQMPGVAGSVYAPAIAPGQKGVIDLALPSNWRTYDVLALVAYDPSGREIYTWTWPIVRPAAIAARIVDTVSGSVPAEISNGDTTVVLSAGGMKAYFGKKTGLLRRVENAKGVIPFADGPTLAAGAGEFQGLERRLEGYNAVVEVKYSKRSLVQQLKWTMYASGWLKMEIHYFPPEYEYPLLGINFSYPEKGDDSVKGIRWMGNGPYRVWKNRMQGVTLGVWDKAYNNTITGEPDYIYPEFKGYFSNFYWARLETARQPFMVVCGNEDVFLRLFTPGDPSRAYNTAPPFPAGNISFMQGIPAIGTKFHKAEDLGPSGRKNMYSDHGRSSEYAKVITLYFDFSGK